MEAFRLSVIICGLIYLPVPIFCVTTETMRVSMAVDVDGTLRNTSHIPSCGAGEKIDLLSYTYHLGDCPATRACDEKPFSPGATVILHEMCSRKEACEGLSFPFRSELETNDTVVIKLAYQCVGHYAPVIEMCDTAETIWNDSLHLISTNFAEFTECTCFVSSWSTLTYNDVRLKAKDGNNCSRAELHINVENTSCSDVVEGYGSVFDKMSEIKIPQLFIALKRSGEPDTPAVTEMVWLIVESQESSTIHCTGKRRKVTTSTKATVVTTYSTTLLENATRNYSANKDNPTGSGTAMSGSVVAVTVIGSPILVLFGLCIIVCVLFFRRKRVRSAHSAKKNTSLSLEKESNLQGGTQSIPLSSDEISSYSMSLKTSEQETDPYTDPSTSNSYAPLRWYGENTSGADLFSTDIDKVYDRAQVKACIKRTANDPTYDHLLQQRKADTSDNSNMLLTDTVTPSSRKAGTLGYSDRLLTDTVTPSSMKAGTFGYSES